MSIVVVATISPKPEHTDAVAAAFAEIIPQVHAEDSCALNPMLRGKLTGPAQIVVSHPVPAGDPAKGQL